MPSWGRPPGAKGSKQRKRWEREKALWEQEQGRIEELDSDDSDTQGVGLAFAGKKFISDSLKFTGVDLSGKQGARRGYKFDDSGSDSEGSRSRSDDDEYVSEKQIALRDKEEALVQSALARIRRAQERGKKEVKLNPEEVEALERRRKRMQSAAISKPRKESASSGGSGSERRRKSDRAMITIPIVSPEPRRHSDRYRDHSPPRITSGGPGMVVEGSDGVLSYAPIGHYPSSRNSPTRPRSSTSLSQQPRHTPPPHLPEHSQGRHYSEEIRPNSSGTAPRLPLPHEEGWDPSSRRSSVSSQGYSRDPFDYQTSSGYPASLTAGYMHASGRRNVSGPPQVSYSSVRRSPPVGTTSGSSKMRYNVASSSDPDFGRRRAEDEVPDSQDSRSSSEGYDDESDDLGNGVSVEPERPSTASSRKPAGGHGHGHGRKKGKR